MWNEGKGLLNKGQILLEYCIFNINDSLDLKKIPPETLQIIHWNFSSNIGCLKHLAI